MTVEQVLKGIEFACPEGSEPLLLDVYLPSAEHTGKGFPAIVHFHGGGWRAGERSSLGPVLDGFGFSPFRRLTDAGFVVVSADYRLSTTAQFPAQLEDAKAAVHWLRDHAQDYSVDPGRIYAWGDSAGGHLASLVGLAPGDAPAGADGDTPGEVAAVAAWYAPSDLPRMGEQSLPNAVARADDPGSREELLIGAVLAEAPGKAAAASPVSYVSPAAPPFLLVHGTADRFVPAAQSTSLAAALEAAGADVELLLIEAADHMWILTDHSQAAAEKAMDATVDFFLRQSHVP
ncbi:alpha/beta hydrolase [Arthrobacter sp. H-02-3]|uniref:alpha/beta hydrolase n=1 Tax=Arthrobacter sp. H-02-3 TaxID=2703675 RepID=UPI000DD20F60|nr:alpha/beta hydrolase [Arthrobacter sp. H-02-3]PVZ59638.1 alpha/beta hydrolase [Arthrobacter sp. H-02-3]